MLRTAFASALAVLGLAAAAPAQVYFPQVPVVPSYRLPYRTVYEVEFRQRSCDRWIVHSTTLSHDRAHIVADYLRRQGYQSRVDHHRY